MKKTDPAKLERLAELRGLGLSMVECAGAVGVSETTAERTMKQERYQKIAADTERTRSGLRADLAGVLRELLTATDSSGQSALLLRSKGAEILARHPELLDDPDADLDEEVELEGVVKVYPLPGTADDFEFERTPTEWIAAGMPGLLRRVSEG